MRIEKIYNISNIYVICMLSSELIAHFFSFSLMQLLQNTLLCVLL